MLHPLQISVNPQTSNTSVQGLKGMAILMILLYHCFPSLYKVGTGIGWMGVDLRLVLTGFILTSFLLDAKAKSGYLKKYLYQRAKASVFSYFILLFIFFLIVPFIAGAIWMNQYSFLYKNQAWYWLYIPNWWVTLLGHWPGIEPNLHPNLDLRILDHLWLPAAEEQFCIILLILIIAFRERILVFVFIYLIIQSVVIRNIFINQGLSYAVSYVFTFARLDAPVIGALIAVLIRNENHKKILEKAALPTAIITFAGIAGIIILTKSITLMNPYFIRIGYTLIALAFGSALLYALSTGSRLGKVMQTKFFQWLGRHSYRLYTYHWILYLLLFPVFSRHLQVISNLTLRGVVISTLCIIAILTVSLISWYMLERFLSVRILKKKKLVL
jgi:peptidoglycan/LPS O-acetylase OafA/YrhL